MAPDLGGAAAAAGEAAVVEVGSQPSGLAVLEEEKAFIAHGVAHVGEGFVEDDQVGFFYDGAEEEGDALGVKGEIAKEDFVGPIDVDG